MVLTFNSTYMTNGMAKTVFLSFQQELKNNIPLHSATAASIPLGLPTEIIRLK